MYQIMRSKGTSWAGPRLNERIWESNIGFSVDQTGQIMELVNE